MARSICAVRLTAACAVLPASEAVDFASCSASIRLRIMRTLSRSAEISVLGSMLARAPGCHDAQLYSLHEAPSLPACLPAFLPSFLPSLLFVDSASALEPSPAAFSRGAAVRLTNMRSKK